ncbi:MULTISPECIES: hypothetical protein [Paenibacillus]|uniref:hypothetical protein n=1 Tax=Paenibacillus TaxID=44249 RepID=UPI0011EADD0B|nr:MULTISPECIES: hypothetical protein [Paenibacillus]MBE0336432.1 hypothetical protein [Paenibacillus sp. 23TSA30-6]
MANTTSLIWNNISDPAEIVTILLSNDDLSTAGVVEIEVFLTIQGVSTPVAHQLFSVPPLITFIRTFNLSSAVAYEVQYNVTGTTSLTVNIFPAYVNGNIIGAQRVLGSESQEISQLTPVP